MVPHSLKVRLSHRLPKRRSLRQQLISQNRTRWLDVGSVKFEEGFECLNLWAPDNLAPEHAKKFHQVDLLALSPAELADLGQFDLVRLQHVFEHFSYEEGESVVKACGALLKDEGYLLISVPDLHKFVKAYLQNFKNMPWFAKWARWRVACDAPASAIFSVHVHQMGYHPKVEDGRAHRWCYDFDGLKHQVAKCRQFREIQNLGLLHPLSEIPFTHGRPVEDVCLLARKRSNAQ